MYRNFHIDINIFHFFNISLLDFPLLYFLLVDLLLDL
jgi:hypothetical protein